MFYEIAHPASLKKCIYNHDFKYSYLHHTVNEVDVRK